MNSFRIFHPSRLVLLLLLIGAAACSDNTSAPASYIHVLITSPGRDSVLTQSPVRITVSVDASCGCQRYVEFRIDDSLHYTDYSSPYEYRWNFGGAPGTHKIHAKGILVGKAEGADSMLVQTR